jgi:hypothetical protein
LFVRSRSFRAVALANQLDDALALVDFIPQHGTEIACLGAKDVLPDRLVPKKGESVSHKLAGAS